MCGTALYSRRTDKPDIVRLRLGTIEPGSEIDDWAVKNHIFVGKDDLHVGQGDIGGDFESDEDNETPKWARMVGEDGAARWEGVERGRA